MTVRFFVITILCCCSCPRLCRRDTEHLFQERTGMSSPSSFSLFSLVSVSRIPSFPLFSVPVSGASSLDRERETGNSSRCTFPCLTMCMTNAIILGQGDLAKAYGYIPFSFGFQQFNKDVDEYFYGISSIFPNPRDSISGKAFAEICQASSKMRFINCSLFTFQGLMSPTYR